MHLKKCRCVLSGKPTCPYLPEQLIDAILRRICNASHTEWKSRRQLEICAEEWDMPIFK